MRTFEEARRFWVGYALNLVHDLALLRARCRYAGDQINQVMTAHLQEAAVVEFLPTKIASTAVFMLS